MENEETKQINLIFLKQIAILSIIWGIVHVLGGLRILVSDTTTKIQSKASAVDPASLQLNYPDAVGGILNQHGFNLFWFGLFTIIGAYFIWKKK